METMRNGRLNRFAKAMGLAVVAGTFALAVSAAPASADGWKKRGHHHHRGPVFVHRPPAYWVPPPRVIYVPPPRYVYAPAPVYVAPPAYYAPPLFNFSFHGRF